MQVQDELRLVKAGLALTILGLLFGILIGASFAAGEDVYKDYIVKGIEARSDSAAPDEAKKIWRYALRTHFHATGIAAFSLGLQAFLLFSSMRCDFKRLTSIFIGLGNAYPLAWFCMFLLAPSMGRGPAHEHLLTQFFAIIGTAGALLGLLMLSGNLFFGLFQRSDAT